ncbi:MAG: SDR family NAD(P)-dependent oxidoreductase [Chloroflexi bacterium]|nr:SDR family NAD(P)-dependent oxidoreductase [Chloroflexota bacterium]
MESYLMITGASGGLGTAFVLEAARRGYNLFLTDLRPDGATFAQTLSTTFGIQARYQPCNLTQPEARLELFDFLRSAGVRFWGLINVAGTDFEGSFLELPRQQFLNVIRLNIEATVDMTHAIIHLRDPERRFMLINVSSMAAFFPMPYKATYAATKRFVLDFSRAIREEIRPFGSVTALCPAGLPTTPETMRAIFAQGFWGMATTMDTKTVARRTLNRALKGRAVYIPGVINSLGLRLAAYLPAGLVARFVGKRWQAAQEEQLSWPPLPKNLEPVIVPVSPSFP